MSRRRRKPRGPGLALALVAAFALGGLAGWSLHPRYEQWRGRQQGSSSPTARSAQGPSRRNGRPPRTAAKLYFARIIGGQIRLVGVRRELQGGPHLAEAALEELISGTVPTGCLRPLPSGARLRSVRVRSGLATADFSRELVSGFKGGSDNEGVTVYAVVNTLASLPEVKRVQILVEGGRIDSIGGHLDTSGPLAPDDELVIPR